MNFLSSFDVRRSMLRSRSRCRSAAGFHLVQTSTSPNSTRYFDDEVPVVRSTTADAPPPSFLPTACSFSEFQSMIVDDVMAVDGALPDKNSVYSSRCGQHTSRSSSRRIIAPFLSQLFHQSFPLASSRTPSELRASLRS